jgi:universal stress protein A
MGAYDRVLVGLDLSEHNAELILERACHLADPDAIEVLHVSERLHTHYEEYPSNQSFPNSEVLDDAIRKEADIHLERICRPFGIKKHRVLGGHPSKVLHEQTEVDVDVVVIGTHGRHGWRLLLGSTPNAVIHGTPCSVLAVRVHDDVTRTRDVYRHMLVALDLTDESSQVLADAQKVAAATGAMIEVCHVLKNRDNEDAEQQALEKLRALGSPYNIGDDSLFVIHGQTAAAIHDLADAHGVDLVVVGTHGKHGPELVTGSSANAVLHGANCDALAVRLMHA